MGDSAQKTWEKYPAALPEGSILAGQYTIQDVLGQGGFGITYLAEDYQSKEKVAVKEFFPESMVMRQSGAPQITAYSGDRQENFRYGMQSFLDEAKILAQFQGNPNIVGVRSYFEENGTAYFVMDYIEGTTLKAYIQKGGGKLGWEEVWSIMSPVMDALEAVHRQGIIHRDVTPDNIIIANYRMVKLLDFGAARYSLGDRSRSLDVVLKAGYAPKEQYTRRGRQGAYTDVYSLAACFYSALCGYLPPESLDRMDEDDLVPLSTRGVKLPEGVEEAILKALEVRAEDRFQTVGEFKRAILDALGAEEGMKGESEAEPTPAPALKPEPKPGSEPKPEPNPNPGQMEKLLKFLKENRVKAAGVVAAAALAGGIFAVQRENARMQEEIAVLQTREAEQQNTRDMNGSAAEKEVLDKESGYVAERKKEEEEYQQSMESMTDDSDEMSSYTGSEKEESEIEEAETEEISDDGIHSYELVVADVTWAEAFHACIARGGYLARITTDDEYQAILRQIYSEEKDNIKFWIAGARQNDSTDYHWIHEDGSYSEEVINSEKKYSGYWLENEPSFYDEMTQSYEDRMNMFYIKSKGIWVWNDVPNDILEVADFYSGTIGYICEYE